MFESPRRYLHIQQFYRSCSSSDVNHEQAIGRLNKQPTSSWTQNGALHRGGAEVARRAHNPEDTGSKPVPGIYTLSALKKPMVIAHATYKLEYRVPGIAQRIERKAHNLEDTGSKPVAGISWWSCSSNHFFYRGLHPRYPPAYGITYSPSYRELRPPPLSPQPTIFFITHFSICHSFLDSYIRALLARKPRGEIWREMLRGRPGWHSRTVVQSHSTHKPSAQLFSISCSIKGNPSRTLCNTP